MPVTSVLADQPAGAGRPAAAGRPQEPPFFRDLNLDQVCAGVTAGREQYDLDPFLRTPLHDPVAVEYRHEVFRDLENQDAGDAVRRFAQRMRAVRDQLAQARKLRYRYQKESWLLAAVRGYCAAVAALASDLDQAELASSGLTGVRGYVAGYVASAEFAGLAGEAAAVAAALDGIAYCVNIRGARVTVSRSEGEADFSADVVATFARFARGAAKDYRGTFRSWPEMNHVEEWIADRVARLFPEEFAALDAFCARHGEFQDETVSAFDREIQFYLGYLDFIAPMKSAGLEFCYPRVSADDKETDVAGAFDLALAAKLAPRFTALVTNDFRLSGPEQIIVVTGPNHGGKTTFARMTGQLHYLAGLGYPVPAGSARLFLPDQVFTHFEREEDLATLRGKLADELARIRDQLAVATGRSLFVMNESFASTTLRDATFIGERVIDTMTGLGLLGVYVTFIDELASSTAACVSMVGTVNPDDPAERTYKIERRPADGLAYAEAIARKYRLTYGQLNERLASVTGGAALPANEPDLASDLELGVLLDAMAGGDKFIYEVARRGLHSGLRAPAEVTYRQHVLADCVARPGVVRDLYDLAVEATEAERHVYSFLFRASPDTILFRSRELMLLYLTSLHRLADLAAAHAADFRSEGFTRFFATVANELSGDYFAELELRLAELGFKRGTLMSARLGHGGKGAGYVLRRHAPARGWRDRLAGRSRASYSFTIPERDEAGSRALSELTSRAANETANSLAQSADHVKGYFELLRAELGFYLGCLSLRERLITRGQPVCYPVPAPVGSARFDASGLYDASLALTLDAPVTGNDAAADGRALIMVTGANQGGKSTFLRSVGQAQLMLQAGMFAPASALSASACTGVFTHYKREEDATMERGKLDEELMRMSAITDRIRPGGLLLCNESFASTNEREGSQIAREIIRAMTEAGIRVVFVTHLYDLAESIYERGGDLVMFLRAERAADGTRTYRLPVGAPLPTSYGEDLYRQVFGAERGDALLSRYAAH